MLNFNQLFQVLDAQWVIAVFTGLTFCLLFFYTYFTGRIAKATEESLRPIVSGMIRSGKKYYALKMLECEPNLVFDTRCIVHNYSKYNLEVFVNLNPRIDGVLTPMGGEYNGEMAWPVMSFAEINGHFDFPKESHLKGAKSITLDLEVSYKTPGGKLYKNNLQHWYWHFQERVWVNNIGVRI